MAWEWLAPVVTGVVGVAGVTGTALTAVSGRRTQLDLARIQSNAEAARSNKAEKRVLYAKVLHQAMTVQVAAVEEAAVRSLWVRNGESRLQYANEVLALHNRYSDAAAELMRLRGELAVVAGPELAHLVLGLTIESGKLSSCEGRDGPSQALMELVSNVNEQLTTALHQDFQRSEFVSGTSK